MRLFDTHCHLDFDCFSADVMQHVESARQCGVERMVLPAIGPSNWQHLRSLSQQSPGLYYALGMHPLFLEQLNPHSFTELRLLLERQDGLCVAVGECGLDAMIEVDMERQEQIFVQQVDIANEFKLPLILHSRKTHHRLLQILKHKQFKYGGVLHGFSGSYQQAMQFVERGFYIGVGGVITYPRANKTRQAITQLALENLVLETDAPDMPLNGYQGTPNHPKRIVEILTTLAELKQMPKQTVAEIVWKNSNLAFGICE
ncbi:TatD family deoxyribonuclease [Vibrio sp. JPW-9-11-11]|uniref:TatD family hydrolase n=1 Tax=Vibrio sp. JPW-9-11-11 TaxID=1416532 RepID=UPI001593F554|nr:TatD family hydrolase [Vibrio sp. JPW-9-11-11]NVD07383.1 TatD family deoxyribonuclease [Vibrio sp. JPW-9-11-11]